MLWWIRRFYNLPPTDPRFLNMTDEQIRLEWEHYLLDNPELRKDDQYIDPSYEEWEQQAIEEDQKITYMEADSSEKYRVTNNRTETSPINSDWEEVEIDIDPVN